MSQEFENFGKHILLEKLASGGMAEVFLARSTGVGGLVKFLAIKRILPQYSDNAEFIKMFTEEAKIIINLSHKNIVGMYEFGKENNRLFLTMDYIEGANLRQITKKVDEQKIKIPLEHALYIIKEVAAGLDYAHRSLDGVTGKPLNIIHRDISPQNIMINFEGEVKIVDFGIAKAANQLEQTMTGTLKGKFSYMSAEQANGKLVDHRTDIFSLGIIMWELLANKRLFFGKDPISVLKSVQKCQIPRITQINPFISPKLEQILMKALSPNPQTRYQRAEILYKELSKFLNYKFPDFSHHDFSDFTKGLFSKNIEILKKKLIKYANLSLTNDLKNSFETESQNNEKIEQKSHLNKETPSIWKDSSDENLEPSFSTSVTEKSYSPDLKKERDQKKNFNFDLNENSISLMKDTDQTMKVDVSQASQKLSNPDKNSSSTSFTRSHYEIENRTQTKKKNFNKSFTKKDEKKESEKQKKILSTDKLKSSKPKTSFSSYNQPLNFPKSNRNSKNNSLISMLFLGSIILFVYLSFHPNASIRNKFKKNLSNLTSSFSSPKKDLNLESSLDKNSLGQKKLSSSSQPLSPESSFLIVNSQPSGARIYIDGKDMRTTTPGRIFVPKNKAFSLVLKKDYYFNFVKKKLSFHQIKGSSFNVKLKKKPKNNKQNSPYSPSTEKHNKSFKLPNKE